MQTKKVTGNTAINEIINPLQSIRGYQLEGIRLHLSAAGGAGNLTITLDSSAGAEYDTVLLTQDMTLVSNLVWHLDKPMLFSTGDMLIIAWANANGRTYGLETIYNQESR